MTQAPACEANRIRQWQGRPMERNHEPRLAVLIDADNTAAKWADVIFKEIATLGEASVRRIYGDFSGTYLRSWQKKLAGLAVIPHQQFAYTKGKNSSDIALVIDAMDLMHTGRFDGFVLVSSDSDFTRLASRLREQGLQVFGIGKKNTPDAFRKACKQFIFVENLLTDADEFGETDEPAEADVVAGESNDAVDSVARNNSPDSTERTPPLSQDKTATADMMRKHPPTKAVPLIVAAMRKHDEVWVPLSVIGSHIRSANPEFDPRTYGCAKLTDLLVKTGQFQVNRDDIPVRARMKVLQ